MRCYELQNKAIIYILYYYIGFRVLTIMCVHA